jgi:hypothetical protein
VVESSGLLNRRTPSSVPGVRIPPSPPVDSKGLFGLGHKAWANVGKPVLEWVHAIRLPAAARGSPRAGVVFRLGQCDKENHGWREGPSLTVPCESFDLLPGPSPSGKVSFK